MKSKLIKATALVLAVLGLAALISVPSYAATDACSALKNGSPAWEAAGCGGSSDKLPSLITNILNAIIAVIGIVAVIFVVIGGVQYMTSAGDTGKTEKAKKTILFALIGLVICALAFAIVNFVISKL